MALIARGKEIINSIASISTAKLPLYKKLWENPNPTVAFAAQNITLLSDDYDFLLWVGRLSTADNSQFATVSEKGASAILNHCVGYNNNGSDSRSRTVTYTDDTHFSIGNATQGLGTGASNTNNNLVIPLAVYGFKKEVDIQSVIASVSTEASRCIMSNGVTVEDAINKGKVTTICDGTKTFAQEFNALFALIDMTKVSTTSRLEWNTGSSILRFYVRDYSSSQIRLFQFLIGASNGSLDTVVISNSSAYYRCDLSTTIAYTNRSNNTPSNGQTLTFYY